MELYINQLAIAISWGSPLFTVEGQGPAITSPVDSMAFERLDCLWRSVENIKSWFESFFSIDPMDLIGMPAHFWSQMVMCLVILKYLATLADPGWDQQAVRNTIDIVLAIDKTLAAIEQTMNHPDLSRGDNFFSLLKSLLMKCRDWAVSSLDYSSNVAAPGDLNGPQEASRVPRHCSRTMPEVGHITALQTMDLENDQWFEDLVGVSGFSM